MTYFSVFNDKSSSMTVDVLPRSKNRDNDAFDRFRAAMTETRELDKNAQLALMKKLENTHPSKRMPIMTEMKTKGAKQGLANRTIHRAHKVDMQLCDLIFNSRF